VNTLIVALRERSHQAIQRGVSLDLKLPAPFCFIHTREMFRPTAKTVLQRGSRAARPSSAAPAAAYVRSMGSSSDKLSYGVVSKGDFGKFKEYSVIHTNRSLNLMSDPFQQVMRNLNDLLKETYKADKVAIIPG
jgi:hypothetical protein